MKWNGIVSQRRPRDHRARGSAQRRRRPSAISTALRRQPGGSPHAAPSRSASVGAELLAQPPDADVDDVRARDRSCSPRPPTGAARGSPPRPAWRRRWWRRRNSRSERSRDVVVRRAPGGGRGRARAPADAQARRCVLDRGRVAQVHAHAGEQLVERERLRQVVVRAEVEAAQLRRQVGARREDRAPAAAAARGAAPRARAGRRAGAAAGRGRRARTALRARARARRRRPRRRRRRSPLPRARRVRNARMRASSSMTRIRMGRRPTLQPSKFEAMTPACRQAASRRARAPGAPGRRRSLIRVDGVGEQVVSP